MVEQRGSGRPGPRRDSVVVIKETLAGGKGHLTNLVFRHGGNVYILTYQRGGLTRHTFIDAGDSRHGGEMLSILAENGVNPADIERIVITHRHPDHFGLAYLLAGESGAKVVAHRSFRDLVEGEVGQMERRWLDNSDLSGLRQCDIEYLHESNTGKTVKLSGVNFPILAEVVDIGEGGRVEILGCPQSEITHSPDQIVVLYSPRDDPHPHEQSSEGFRPTDDIIFSGDLWLMRGPMFSHDMTDIRWRVRAGLRQMRSLMSGGSVVRRDPRVQDAEAKDALKKGFCLIRVKPGHGNEFLGARIIPRSLLADRDLLVEFGYPFDASLSLLKSSDLAPRVTARREEAYVSFINELVLWTELGYTPDEISGLLVRIYREQVGGGPLVEKDRHERRERLKGLLARLRADEAQPDSIRRLAESTQSLLTSAA
jgi:glyoxylase-like metal-dependent hydrolase (beta-lactamase superfamily II)